MTDNGQKVKNLVIKCSSFIVSHRIFPWQLMGTHVVLKNVEFQESGCSSLGNVVTASQSDIV
jgi:hypothetical protein